MTPAASAKEKNSPLRQALMCYLPEYRKAAFFSLLTSLMTLVPTFFMLQVYDRVVNSRSVDTLLMLIVLVVGAYIVMELLDVVRTATMRQASLALDASLRERLFDTTFEVNLRRGGGASGQLFSDLRTLREFMYSPAMFSLMDSPSSLIFLIIVSVIHPFLGLVALFGALVQFAIAVRTERRTMPLLTEANKASMEAQAYASSTLRNPQVIEAMGMMEAVRKRWMVAQRKSLKLQADASDHNGYNNATGKFIQTAQGSLILGLSCWLSLQIGQIGFLTGGMMIVASVLGARVLAPLVQLVAQWRLVVNARDAYGRLDEVLRAVPEKEPTMPLPPPVGKLTVEAVTAGAPGSPMPILRAVAFGAQPGEVVVVVGPSASGKTTLARLLTGVWPAMSGKVRLDGADVFAWNKEELGPYVGYLPQGVELFDGTIAENIARFGNVDIDKVREAAAMIGLDAWIDSLPDGFDTRIGDDGAFLSGGQRQRVGIARALYGMPRFLVLDEPNSNLDEAGDAALVAALGRLKAAGCTTIVMSHRASILPAADRLLVLRDGQVAAFGPRDEVLAALQKGQAQAAPAAAGATAGRVPRISTAPPGPPVRARPGMPGSPVGGAA